MSPDGEARGLTPSQLEQWSNDGFLILPDALDRPTVDKLLEETHRMLDGFSLEDHPMTRFSTGEGKDQKHVGDDYFLTSGDKIRYFFEEDAFDTNGQLTVPKSRAVNKIGHALHDLSAPFQAVTISTENVVIVRSLGFRDPRVLQSMVICKQPSIGGRVPPHQDSTFLYTDPPSAVGFWYALEDATVENGCLSFARGSHRRAEIEKRFVRIGGVGTGFMDVEDEAKRWPHNTELYQRETRNEAPDEEYTITEVPAGSLVLIHGNVLHKSEKNTSGRSRFIYTFHVIEGEYPYDERNWLQPSSEGFTRLVGGG